MTDENRKVYRRLVVFVSFLVSGLVAALVAVAMPEYRRVYLAMIFIAWPMVTCLLTLGYTETVKNED